MSFFNVSDVHTALLIEHEVLAALKADPNVPGSTTAIDATTARIEALRKVWRKKNGGFCVSYEEQARDRLAHAPQPPAGERRINIDGD